MMVRRTSELHGAARRADAILLLDDGLSCKAIAKVLYIDDDTERGYERWSSGSEKTLASFDLKGAKRTLNPEQEAGLIIGPSAPPFSTSSAVKAHVRVRLGFEYRKRKALPA